MVFDSVRGYVQLASGLSELTRARATEAANGLLSLQGAGIESGSKLAVQVGALAEELLVAATTNRRNLIALVRSEVDAAVNRLGLVSTEKLQESKAEAARLRAEVATLRSASVTSPVKKAAAKTASVKKAAAKRAAAKGASVKEAGAKKAAAKRAPVKKAPVKKAPAKKAAANTASVKKAAAKKFAAKGAPVKSVAVKQAPAVKQSAPTMATSATNQTPAIGTSAGPVAKAAVVPGGQPERTSSLKAGE